MTRDPFHNSIDLIKKRLGLKQDLLAPHAWEEMLRERMAKCQLQSHQAYYTLLLQSPQEMQEIVEKITISETWFFRDGSIFDYLRLLIKQGSFHTFPIKFLCLACSSGEEPYSIAMALFDAGLTKDAFSIDAVDISQLAIQKANSGTFRENSFRGKELSYRQRWFTKTAAGYVIHQKIKEKVSFYRGNFLEDTLPYLPLTYHVIFCRNLLIYLNPAAQQSTLNLIKHYLLPEGILTVGPAETQIAFQYGYFPVKAPNAYAFQMTQAVRDHAWTDKGKRTSALKSPQKNRVPLISASSLQNDDAKEQSLRGASDSHSGLFERIPSKKDIMEWTEALMNEPVSEEAKSSLSVLVFRLGNDFFALRTVCVKEVARLRKVHCIPHRSGARLLGMINLNGELQLCISLHRFLEIEPSLVPLKDKNRNHQERVIAIAKEGDLWVFSVDGIEGIYNLDLTTVENVPVNIAKSTVNFIRGIVKMGAKSVGVIDDELLFASLKRSLS